MWFILYTSLQLQMPCAYSLPTLSFFAEMVNVLTLVWVAFLGVRFEVGRGGVGWGKITPPGLKLIKIMLET